MIVLYYKEYGKLVVFIHGGFTTNESFIHQYTVLPEYRCIFVDLPNHDNAAWKVNWLVKSFIHCRKEP